MPVRPESSKPLINDCLTPAGIDNYKAFLIVIWSCHDSLNTWQAYIQVAFYILSSLNLEIYLHIRIHNWIQQKAIYLKDSKELYKADCGRMKGMEEKWLHYNLKIINNEKEFSYLPGGRNCPEASFNGISFYLYVIRSQQLIAKGSEYEKWQ